MRQRNWKTFLPTAEVKEITNVLSSEFIEGSGRLWLYNKALIYQPVPSIPKIFGPSLTLFGPYFKTTVQIFFRMDIIIGL